MRQGEAIGHHLASLDPWLPMNHAHCLASLLPDSTLEVVAGASSAVEQSHSVRWWRCTLLLSARIVRARAVRTRSDAGGLSDEMVHDVEQAIAHMHDAALPGR